ncbi:hypothetical protein SKAU_G00310160 [Synaphobranchus kaupii]|uniref:Uncharacterized protein n=1 Tax=Synaphobranchus kaupii TaxID=118154 RepID=A0A9Q1ERM6_SYNKA|nr:hypothetical protein SKAU_G00310160 [Synaphobranchus kaupii]
MDPKSPAAGSEPAGRGQGEGAESTTWRDQSSATRRIHCSGGHSITNEMGPPHSAGQYGRCCNLSSLSSADKRCGGGNEHLSPRKCAN